MGVPISAPLVPQRKGISSQLIWIPELDGPDKDPTSVTAFSMPLSDKTSYKVHGDMSEAEIYDGTQLPPDLVDGNRMADGTVNLGLEYVFQGRLLKAAFGTNGYNQPEGSTGRLKEFTIPTTLGSSPMSGQIVRRSNEATAQLLRSTGNFVNTIHYPFATSGRATCEVNFMGSGREYRTLPAGFTSVTNDGYSAMSYFNMQIVVNGYIVAGLTNFDDTIDFHASRQEVGANNGYAGGVNVGYIGAGGTLGVVWSTDGAGIESNFNLLDLAENQTEFAIDCIYSDKPLNIATQWFRRRYWVRVAKSTPDFGGNAGLLQEAKWMLKRSANALWAAERFNDNLGPFTLNGTNNVLAYKIDGAGAISTTLPTGSVTNAAAVTALQANGALTAVADVDYWMGRIRVTTKTKGSLGSVQCDTTVANSAHTILGLTNTIYTGKGVVATGVGCPLIYTVYNQLLASF
jgi:hypothetical protein